MCYLRGFELSPPHGADANTEEEWPPEAEIHYQAHEDLVAAAPECLRIKSTCEFFLFDLKYAGMRPNACTKYPIARRNGNARDNVPCLEQCSHSPLPRQNPLLPENKMSVERRQSELIQEWGRRSGGRGIA